MTTSRARRVVVGISGSTGAIYGIRTLEMLRTLPDVDIHLVVSGPAKRTIVEETDLSVRDVESLAHQCYDDRDIGAAIASGSFRTEAMIVAPCSIKTAAALAYSLDDTLIVRAGDVALKEGRPLIVAVRETPLHVGHLRHLLALAEAGAIVYPPVPALYHRPATIDELVTHTVGRMLQRAGLAEGLVEEWQGSGRSPERA